MVKPRAKKTNRGTTPQDLFDTAAKEVIEGNASVRGTAKKYGMCHVSLFRYVTALKQKTTPKLATTHIIEFYKQSRRTTMRLLRSFRYVIFWIIAKTIA